MENKKYLERSFLSMDCEFTTLNPREARLISLAITPICLKNSENNNSSFYAEFNDYPINICSEFTKENVLKNLFFNNVNNHYFENNRNMIFMKDNAKNIKINLNKWLANYYKINNNKELQFIVDLGNYDWNLFIELIGTKDKDNSYSLPNIIDYIFLDISTMLFDSGYDPNINREKLIGKETLNQLNKIIKNYPIGNILIKHNCLYDSIIQGFIGKSLILSNGIYM